MFLSAADVKMLAVVDVRAWVGEIGHVRIGVAAIQGRVSTLLRLGRDLQPTVAKPALVCELESGDTVLLEGGAVERTGRFPVSAGPAPAVSWGGVEIPVLDVNALYQENGEFRFDGGFHGKAFIALVIGMLFSSILPTFTTILPAWWGTYGWFFGVGIGEHRRGPEEVGDGQADLRSGGVHAARLGLSRPMGHSSRRGVRHRA